MELFRGLAQRNKGRKTSYLDGRPPSLSEWKIRWSRRAPSAPAELQSGRSPLR